MQSFTVALGVIAAHDLFNGRINSIIEVAEIADQIGIDQIVFTDHVIMSANTHRYPFGSFPMPPEYPWFEPITLMAAVAGRTHRIRLATGILITPLRPPVLLAKQLATLDQLSCGRVDLGVGVGWQPEEYESQGLDFDQRWGLLEDGLEAMQALWREAPVSVHNNSVHFDQLYSQPFPYQKTIPIWFGVAPTAKQAERIAKYGEGWIPIKTQPEFVRDGKAMIAEAFMAAGRHPAEIKIRAHAAMDFSANNGKADWQKAVDSAYALVDAGASTIEFELAPFLTNVKQVDALLRAMVELKSAHT